MHKKAIELSLNFIVILIISIIIFGFGVKFISDLSKSATNLQQMTLSELDERIGNLVCEGSDRVCVGVERKTIPRTKFDVFGVKILNILDPQQFVVTVLLPTDTAGEFLGYRNDKRKIMPSSDPDGFKGLIVNPIERDVDIGKNEEKTIGIGIQVPPNAVSGTYIFNVEIKTQIGQPYSQIQKLYVDVP